MTAAHSAPSSNDHPRNEARSIERDRGGELSAGGEDRHDSPRACGRCTACCVRLSIPAGVVAAGPKTEGRPCPLLGACGCSVYPSRPAICRDFVCTWLKSPDWPPEWRPDRVGLLCITETLGESLIGALVYELHPGALQSSAAAAMVKRLRDACDFVVTVTESGLRQLTPGLRVDRGEPARRAPHFSRNTVLPRPTAPSHSTADDAP